MLIGALCWTITLESVSCDRWVFKYNHWHCVLVFVGVLSCVAVTCCDYCFGIGKLRGMVVQINIILCTCIVLICALCWTITLESVSCKEWLFKLISFFVYSAYWRLVLDYYLGIGKLRGMVVQINILCV